MNRYRGLVHVILRGVDWNPPIALRQGGGSIEMEAWRSFNEGQTEIKSLTSAVWFKRPVPLRR
jgi:hypothetical protein